MQRLLAVAALAGVVAAVLVVVLSGGDERPSQASAEARPVAFAAVVASPRSFRAESVRRAELRALWTRRERGDEHVFPIRGRHDRGRYETNDFGGGRGHQGQDMFADCGT
ncbi:MAG TPA: hypothetical protein VLK58_03405, partial [Conexibacter sp.]|nr:hypothetical protein [Conexibacter sp.]